MATCVKQVSCLDLQLSLFYPNNIAFRNDTNYGFRIPAAHPNCFVIENAQLFKGLFQVLADSSADVHPLLGILRPHLSTFFTTLHEQLHAGEQQRRHALMSEIFSGMVRASKQNFTYEATEQMWNCWLPLFQRVINDAPLECLSTWLQSIRFAVYNLDPRRVAKLSIMLFAQVEKLQIDNAEGPPTSSLSDTKILQIVQPLLAEFTVRCCLVLTMNKSAPNHLSSILVARCWICWVYDRTIEGRACQSIQTSQRRSSQLPRSQS